MEPHVVDLVLALAEEAANLIAEAVVVRPVLAHVLILVLVLQMQFTTAKNVIALALVGAKQDAKLLVKIHVKKHAIRAVKEPVMVLVQDAELDAVIIVILAVKELVIPLVKESALVDAKMHVAQVVLKAAQDHVRILAYMVVGSWLILVK